MQLIRATQSEDCANSVETEEVIHPCNLLGLSCETSECVPGDRDSPGEPPCAAPRTSTLDHLVNDTGSDIADVESRLNALQNFIRMARISADPGSGGQ